MGRLTVTATQKPKQHTQISEESVQDSYFKAMAQNIVIKILPPTTNKINHARVHKTTGFPLAYTANNVNACGFGKPQKPKKYRSIDDPWEES